MPSGKGPVAPLRTPDLYKTALNETFDFYGYLKILHLKNLPD